MHINGHEYAKRKLAFEGIEFEARDNGILSYADPTRLQQILDDSNETRIGAKEDHALRTESSIDNTYNLGLGRSLENPPNLRATGLAANCRLLELEIISQNCSLAEGVFEQVSRSQIINEKNRSDDLFSASLLEEARNR
uniref:Uncharacterized protein n=1 Tax=Candidatus Kentrum sp. TC TaxID=2126339 RepID=A0A450Z8D5_9GAMM|nr:MAG: hypothetical protein BECKTC1821D_GA0114238_10863 [Candidatus Kentron sp. TC]